MAQAEKFRLDLTKTFDHLPSAPIVEAIIHWAARAVKPWQPDTLKEFLTAKLPTYTRCESQRELHFRAEIDPEGAKTQMRRDSFLGLRLTSSDKLHIAQFNRDGLIFSRLKPYSDWESFSAEGLRLWQVFLDLADPSEVERLGVRFINQITLEKVSDVRKVLTKPPKCLESMGLPLSSFFYQSMYDVPQHPYGINVTQAIQAPAPPDNDKFRLILDIDVFTTEPFESGSELLPEHLSKMRYLKDEAFFTLLKSNVIGSFKIEPK